MDTFYKLLALAIVAAIAFLVFSRVRK